MTTFRGFGPWTRREPADEVDQSTQIWVCQANSDPKIQWRFIRADRAAADFKEISTSSTIVRDILKTKKNNDLSNRIREIALSPQLLLQGREKSKTTKKPPSSLESHDGEGVAGLRERLRQLCDADCESSRSSFHSLSAMWSLLAQDGKYHADLVSSSQNPEDLSSISVHGRLRLLPRSASGVFYGRRGQNHEEKDVRNHGLITLKPLRQMLENYLRPE